MSLTSAMVQAAMKAMAGFLYADVATATDKATKLNATELFTQKQLTFTKEANDAAAGTATAETGIMEFEKDVHITRITFLPSAGVTAHATNFATLLVDSRDGAGGAATNRATFATDTVTTDDLTAFVPKDLSVTAFDLNAGEILTFEITKSGTGVVIPRGVVIVTYQLR